MSSQDQGNTIQDILKWEQDNYHSREAVTVLSGQNLSLGAVIGKITKSIPAAGTPADGNTGGGTVTGVTGGTKTRIGEYALVCAGIPAGAATVPATGTAPVSPPNTGGGTVTGVTGGEDVQIGDYILACIGVPEGAAVVPAEGASDGGNTGAGTVTGVTGGDEVKIGTYTITCLTYTASPLAATFEVKDPDGNLLSGAALGAYANEQINFTITDGSPAITAGDIWTIEVTEASHAGGTFTVTAPDGSALPDATVGAAYSNEQINFTINDGDPDFAVGDTFTISVTEASHAGGTFTVTAPDGSALPDAIVDAAYTNPQINFTINDGSPDFAVGDSFTITVAEGSGKVKEIDFDAADGSREAYGFTLAAYDASSADLAGVAIVRDAVIVADDLVWPATSPAVSSAQKAAALAELALKGIVTRSEA
jgi:hypothetical protein